MLINEILDLSRVEAGRYELKEEAVSLPGVVEECRHLLALRAKNRVITISERSTATCRASGPTSARCARSPSTCSATQSSSPRMAARSRSRSAGPTIGGQYLSIRDTGPGIPEEEIPIVLSSFGRGSMAQKNADEGTGLGLPIVRGLVELHGGEFKLISKVREGTEVDRHLPARAGDERAAATRSQCADSEAEVAAARAARRARRWSRNRAA